MESGRWVASTRRLRVLRDRADAMIRAAGICLLAYVLIAVAIVIVG